MSSTITLEDIEAAKKAFDEANVPMEDRTQFLYDKATDSFTILKQGRQKRVSLRDLFPALPNKEGGT